MTTVESKAFKDGFYSQLARISAALASPRRLELIDLLAQGERAVEDLARECSMSVANTSRHLQILRWAGLVTVRRQGLFGFYSLAGPGALRIWQAIRDLGGETLAEIDRLVRTHLADRGVTDRVDATDLLDRMRRNEVMVIDVRPETEFQAGHITGAHSIPLEDLEESLRVLSDDRDIVVYCRGRFCEFSTRAVSLLQQRGFRARRLDVGFPDWQVLGLPVRTREPAA